MTKVMQGFRVLEVAQFTFVPAAGGILADWGADVIKVEHPSRGDMQRGFINMGGVKVHPDRHPLMEHPNRGKRSVGIDLSTPEGQEVLYALAKQADVFLTNFLPSVRQKLRFDLEHIRAVNPKIIYARGSAFGDKGAERDIGGYDGTAFWTRSGVGHSITPEGIDGVIAQGSPAFGDSIGGMNMAGGISAALLHRERTGEALEVDVSLLSSAWWAAGANIAQGIETGIVARSPMPDSRSFPDSRTASTPPRMKARCPRRRRRLPSSAPEPIACTRRAIAISRGESPSGVASFPSSCRARRRERKISRGATD